MFVQYFLGAGMAFPAASGDAQVAAQFGHVAQAQSDGLTDFTIRYVVADTNNHRCTFWLDKMRYKTRLRSRARSDPIPFQSMHYCFFALLMRIIIITFSIVSQSLAFCKR
jgi:hypothetical protein